MLRYEDESGFRHYQKEPNGKEYPSVTSILDRYEDKAKLNEWIRKNGEDYCEFIRHYTASIGT